MVYWSKWYAFNCNWFKLDFLWSKLVLKFLKKLFV